MITAEERNLHEEKNRAERVRCFLELDVAGFKKAFPDEPRRILDGPQTEGKSPEEIDTAEFHAARYHAATGQLTGTFFKSKQWLSEHGFQTTKVGQRNPTTAFAWRDREPMP